MPAPAVIAGLFSIGEKLIDHWFPDAEEADKRKAEFALMLAQNKMETLKISMSAIVAEAESEDPWTSRARPTFLYVIYVMILISIPMGILSAFQPEIAARIATGMQLWLAAIPDGLWALFGVGYTGYAVNRTYDKHSENKHTR